MKIEKISDNQIRCTLNKLDLISREIKISELAYGTEKAKRLFQDMMQQASHEFGFEADDFPLMIEAIPISADCIVLVITKVDDPDELDTRFSRFSPSHDDEDSDEDYEDGNDYNSNYFSRAHLNGADDILEMFMKNEDDFSENEDFTPLPDIISPKESMKEFVDPSYLGKIPSDGNLVKIFSFTSLQVIEQLSVVLKDLYQGINTLYKDPRNSNYYLVVNKTDHTPIEFNKICNIISEYGNKEISTTSKEAYYREHLTVIIKNKALQVLSSI